MNQMTEYIKNEKEELVSRRGALLSKIHICELNMESFGKAINRLEKQRDTTGDVFKSSKAAESTEDREIAALEDEKSRISKKVDTMNIEVKNIESKLAELSEILKADAQNSVDGYKILAVRENERQRIARDIHDSVVQKMTAAIYKAEFAQKVMDSDMQRAKLELEIMHNTIHDCVNELRAIIYDLRPSGLDDIGFKETLERFVKICSMDSTFKLSLQVDDNINNNTVDSIILITIIRVVQELTNNTVKYAEATELDINIYSDDDNIIVIHKDNGKGFTDADLVKRADNSGFGTAIVKERISMLGGSIECSHEKGTCYRIVIPCQFNVEGKNAD